MEEADPLSVEIGAQHRHSSNIAARPVEARSITYLTRSKPLADTIGIVEVADFAACTAPDPPAATITAACWWMRSLASIGSCPNCKFAQRNSIATVRPSTYPASLMPSPHSAPAPP